MEKTELHPGHALLRDRVRQAPRRRALVVAMCEHGVKDTIFRRNLGHLFTDEEVKLIESFIDSI